jgi:fumarate hydratase subunit alpha
MRDIRIEDIIKVLAGLCQDANFKLPDDVLNALNDARRREESPAARRALDTIIENAAIARTENIPLCQDCGTAVVFLDIGQEVHITGGDLDTAISEGVKRGYALGYLRKSMVSRPFSERTNTKNNIPPVLHTRIVPGDKLKITFMPRGGGAENMSRLAMLKPGAGSEGIIQMVTNTVSEAGGSPCPPIIIGLGIGATAEMAMLMAKESLLRLVKQPSPDAEVAALEAAVLERVNSLGIGALGLGGTVTALAVHAETAPTHMASLPVAVNLQCHSARHCEITI